MSNYTEWGKRTRTTPLTNVQAGTKERTDSNDVVTMFKIMHTYALTNAVNEF